jgi:hypothetical protein
MYGAPGHSRGDRIALRDHFFHRDTTVADSRRELRVRANINIAIDRLLSEEVNDEIGLA